MKLKNYQDDFKYFFNLGICSASKYFSPLGEKMINAAHELRDTKDTEIAKALEKMYSFKVKDAMHDLEGLIKKYPNDQEIETLLALSRVIVLETVEGHAKKGKTSIIDTHDNMKKNISEDLKTLSKSEDSNVSGLAESILEKI